MVQSSICMYSESISKPVLIAFTQAITYGDREKKGPFKPISPAFRLPPKKTREKERIYFSTYLISAAEKDLLEQEENPLKPHLPSSSSFFPLFFREEFNAVGSQIHLSLSEEFNQNLVHNSIILFNKNRLCSMTCGIDKNKNIKT